MNATLSSLQAAKVTHQEALTIKMTHAAGQATPEDPPVLQATIGLAEQIRAASEEIERGRRLPPHIVAAMKDANVFGMTMPRALGGLGSGPVDAVPRHRGAGPGRRLGWMVRDDWL
jgi:alkylation response protein AidB-like acyl-CoA dehydrogenase